MRRTHRRDRAGALACLTLLVSLLAPSAALAGHAAPLPDGLEDALAEFAADLDLLLQEFDQQVGDFEDDRLNRALVKARESVVVARGQVEDGDLTAAIRAVRSAMRELEKGASVPVSGSGFADDLASFGSFLTEAFLADLIDLVTVLGAVSTGALADATLHYEEGVAARTQGEWENAVSAFLKTVQVLERDWSHA